MKTFEQWDIDDVERTFGLRRVKDSAILQTWLSAKHTVNKQDRATLDSMREELADAVDLWNEDELKFHFIAPLMRLIHYTNDKFRPFTQRKLTAVVNDVKLTGRVDFMVATGKSKPIQPFFFLHEYKKEHGSESDPRAQLLVEMLVARELNAAQYPLYGCYVVGRNWFFLVLDGDVYAESKQYAASDDDDILNIYSILCEAKVIITRLAEKYA